MNLKFLFVKSYWLAYPPSLKAETAVLYLTVLGVLFLLGIAAKVVFSRAPFRGYIKSALGRLGNLFLSGAVVGGILLFFRYEYLPFLSFRIWFGFWLLWLLVWGAFILRHWFLRKKDFEIKAAERGAREEMEEYFPKKKK